MLASFRPQPKPTHYLRFLLVSLPLLLIATFVALEPTVSAMTAAQRRSFANRGIYFIDDPCAEGTTDTLPENIPAGWRELLSKAAAARETNVQLLAAIYLTENGNEWRPLDYAWPSSPAGAMGPFQFLPGTWDGHKADGNGDGVMDVMNVYDAALAAADMIASIGAAPTTPLGNIDRPLTHDTLLYVSVAYNAGPGFAARSDPNTPLASLATEPREYAMNVNSLISSGFTKSGKPGYADPHVAGDAQATTGTSGAGGCSSGFGTDLANIAIGLAWPDAGHGKNMGDATPAYQKTMPEVNGSTDNDGWSDCGVFVATVVLASGVDPDYPKRGTYNQVPYLEGPGSAKWQVFRDFTDTSQLLPGDILIFDGAGGAGHTYMYVGPAGGANLSRGASFHDHVPEGGGVYFDQQGYHFLVARLKK